MRLTRLLNDRVVYWAPAPPDVYGRKGFAAPVELRARWEDGVTDLGVGTPQAGTDIQSKTVVYTAVRVEPSGVLWNGTFDRLVSLSEPFANPGAAEVSVVNPVKDLRLRETVWETVL